GATESSRPPPPPRQQMATAALRSCPATEPRQARVSSGKSTTVRNCTPMTQAIWRTSFTTVTRCEPRRPERICEVQFSRRDERRRVRGAVIEPGDLRLALHHHAPATGGLSDQLGRCGGLAVRGRRGL